ncbi:hypothetical protein [Dysgonomonas sp. ZJ279]|uniref:hypothetical protein n=1 Tax=Dysgonomonas sp. ZJ279 TaxID=2709796 RepID=UPI0013EB17CB|nr:hypothetical protein [Dysgonomonas sp. ZJ279]
MRDVRSMRDALALATTSPSQYPSLARLRADFGDEKIETVIKLYLIDVCDMVNIKRPLREPQIEALASEIVATYYSLSIADIHVIFRKAKTGEYGEFYESLDMPKVMGWFRQYFDDRCAIGEQESINGKYNDATVPSESERMTRYFERLAKKKNK